jgi:MinD-like ATPase involved in chromosome partitioning or flagellar assembly
VSTVAVCSGKGSPGATFVATNLAAAMAGRATDMLLLDLDPAGGDVCCYLGLDPRKGLYPLLRMEGIPTDPKRLVAEADTRSGFLAVSGFPDVCELSGSPETLVAVLRTAKLSGRTVVVDIGRVSEANAPLAAEADVVLLVVRPDLVSVLGAERALRCLETATVSHEKVVAVVCGLERRRPGDRAEVADALRLPVLGAVPLDRRRTRKALIAQAPASARRFRRAFGGLAATVQHLVATPGTADEPQIPDLVRVAT